MKNTNGFSLIELLAVLMLSTVVLVPMMFSLTNNLEVNHRLINRNAASLLSQTSLIGFDLMDYEVLKASVSNSDDAYFEYNIDKPYCALGTGEITNSDICYHIFTSRANNIQFEADEFRAFVYPYYLSDDDVNLILEDDTVPDSVKQEISRIMEDRDGTVIISMLNVTLWIRHGSNPQDVIVRSGVITREIE